jgi:hypothetical protein
MPLILSGSVMLAAAAAMRWQARRHHFSTVGGFVALAAAAATALRLVVPGDPLGNALGLAASLAFVASPLLFVRSYRSAIRAGTFRGPLRIVSAEASLDLERPAG